MTYTRAAAKFPNDAEHMAIRIAALEKVALLAGQVVLEIPVRSSYALQSYVRRSLIGEIEEALVAAGYDMKAARNRLMTLKSRDAQIARRHLAAESCK